VEPLTESDLRALLELVRRVGDAASVDEFAERCAAAVHDLIPADLTSYNELDPARGRAFVVSDPAINTPQLDEDFARHMDDNPLVGHYWRTHDPGSHTLSEFMTPRQLHRTALYDTVYASFGGEYMLGNQIAAPERVVLALAFFRQYRDFTARERALLDLAGPYLREAYRSAEMRGAFAGLERALEDEGQGLIVLGRRGRVVHATRRARDLLSTYFEPSDDPLPGLLAAWLRRIGSDNEFPPPAEPLIVERDGPRLVARLLAGPPDVVQLKEEQVGLSAEAIVSLGLSRRENDVLVLVAQGVKDSEAARTLGITTRTVHKHLEQIYEKLGVHTRTAAAARAHEAARAAA
jgi:DNA-binding CsgD family transcriptional regulator